MADPEPVPEPGSAAAAAAMAEAALAEPVDLLSDDDPPVPRQAVESYAKAAAAHFSTYRNVSAFREEDHLSDIRVHMQFYRQLSRNRVANDAYFALATEPERRSFRMAWELCYEPCWRAPLTSLGTYALKEELC